jgi:hypothetical protein
VTQKQVEVELGVDHVFEGLELLLDGDELEQVVLNGLVVEQTEKHIPDVGIQLLVLQ